MLRFFSNRWSLLCLAVLIAGVSGGAVALGEHAATERHDRVQMIDGLLYINGTMVERELLDHAPVIQDHALRGSSSWANTYLGRDHITAGADAPKDAEPARTPRPGREVA